MVYDDYADIGIFAKWVMDAPEIGEVEIMADEPLKDGFCLQVEKGLWIRLDRAPAVRLVGQIVDAFLRVVLRPSDCLEPFSAIRIGTDKSALEPVVVVGDLVCPYGIAVLIKSKRNPHL